MIKYAWLAFAVLAVPTLSQAKDTTYQAVVQQAIGGDLFRLQSEGIQF